MCCVQVWRKGEKKDEYDRDELNAEKTGEGMIQRPLVRHEGILHMHTPTGRDALVRYTN